MQLELNGYFHIFNRTNNQEALFRSEENYIYFLKKYRYYFDSDFDTICYCLMPTHFHFLVKISTDNISGIKKKFGELLRTYTRGYNKQYNRTGSLFQQNTKSKIILKEEYLKALVVYIHQNPLRSDLVEKQEDWKFSSFNDFVGFRNGSLPKIDIILNDFNNDKKKFYEYSSEMLNNSKSFNHLIL